METTVQVPSDNIMPQPGPVNIVKIGSDGKLVLDEEGLRKIVCSDDVKDLDVAVVSIAGTYRSGKSFLMNLLASYLQRYQEGEVDEKEWPEPILQGFDYRGGADTVTKGIWIWSKPFIIKLQDKKVCVLLLDTEGENDVGTSQHQDMKIYCLTAMISSVLIYNVMRLYGAGDNKLLQVYTSLAHLCNSTTQKEDTLCQRLCILIRDWPWIPDNKNKPPQPGYFSYGLEGGKEYKKQKITPQGPDHDKHLLSLDQAFQHVDCFLMPKPCPKIESASLENPPFYSGDFKEHIKLFAECLFKPEKIVVKKNFSKPLKCAEMMNRFKTFTDAIQDGIQLATLEEANVKQLKEKVRNNLKKTYKQKMESLQLPVPLSDDDFNTRYEKRIAEVISEVSAYLKNAEEWNDVFEEFKSDGSTQRIRNEHFKKNKEKRYKEVTFKPKCMTLCGGVGAGVGAVVVGAAVVPGIIVFATGACAGVAIRGAYKWWSTHNEYWNAKKKTD